MTASERVRALRQANELAEKLRPMTPIQRTIAANNPENGSTAVRIIALTRSGRDGETEQIA